VSLETKTVQSVLFQMQTHIIFVLLILSGAVSASSESLLRLTEYIYDIYQQFPHSCIFIINCESQQQGEIEFYMI